MTIKEDTKTNIVWNIQHPFPNKRNNLETLTFTISDLSNDAVEYWLPLIKYLDKCVNRLNKKPL